MRVNRYACKINVVDSEGNKVRVPVIYAISDNAAREALIELGYTIPLNEHNFFIERGIETADGCKKSA